MAPKANPSKVRPSSSARMAGWEVGLSKGGIGGWLVRSRMENPPGHASASLRFRTRFSAQIAREVADQADGRSRGLHKSEKRITTRGCHPCAYLEMPEGVTQFSPRVLKENLRNTLGDFIVEKRLGQYLDFNVVVIPTGKHVTKFPTADAAFHPYESEEGVEAGEALEIRVVPWLIVKVTSTQTQSESLDDELQLFWMAGVQEVWELAAHDREVKRHRPRGKPETFVGTDLVPQTEVLPDFFLYVKQLFHGIDDEHTVLPEAEGPVGEGWSMPLVSEATQPKKLQRRGSKVFVPAPDTDARDVYRDADDEAMKKAREPVGLGKVFTALFSSWFVRIAVALIAGLVIGTIIQLVSNTDEPDDPTLADGATARQTKEERARILVELVKQTVRDFLGAETIEEKLKYVREPEKIRPLMENFYRTGQGKLRAETVRLFVKIETTDINEQSWYVAEILAGDKNLTAFLEPVAGIEGEFRIDWPAFVGFNKTTYGEALANSTGEPALFRVQASLSDRISAYFSEEDYQGFVLHFPLEKLDTLAYMRRSSADFSRLETLIQDGWRVPLIVSLDWPKDRRKRDEVEILTVESEDWLGGYD
ncbi:MAG: Uma2 family endonuclease [Verrucomicrobiota bacterium]